MNSCLVSNLSGSFALFGIESRYQGVFFHSAERMYKTIAEIVPAGKGPMRNALYEVTRQRGKSQESFWFAHHLPVFFYESQGPSDVLLDCRLNFDNREWGRHYEFSDEDGVLFVHFHKRDDGREAKIGEYDFWLAFYGCTFERIDQWEERAYTYDHDRKSPPYARYVLRALKAQGSFSLAFAASKEGARRLAVQSWLRKEALRAQAKAHAEKCTGAMTDEENEATALECAKYSLACLSENHGLFAGLPWFHQRWARDELISIKGLILSNQQSLAKVILLDWLGKLLPDGSLPGTQTMRIADSGWLFVRCEDMLEEFNAKERAYVLAKCLYFLDCIEKNLKDGLVHNGPKETWMDSLDRSGARIEIQALALAACRLARKLGKEVKLEQMLSGRVKNAFWRKTYLADGETDGTIRPNIFLAAYVYPELLSKKEWLQCFDTVLPKLWCDWGGLASIDKTDQMFVPNHTGEDPTSYHNGDSWFYLNNLTAIVLHRLDKKRYAKYIEHIAAASTQEILLMGAIGHHAELSSASALESRGCLAQAWSAALYVELAQIVKHKKAKQDG